jgi:hypothetical protein
MKKIYISGKITGIEEEAPALFAQAEQELSEMGFEPVNPMKLQQPTSKEWRDYMKGDIKALCDCEGIYMLTNWRMSQGANIELKVANYLEMDVIHQHRKMPKMNKR